MSPDEPAPAALIPAPVAEQLRLTQLAKALAPRAAAPYFVHLRVLTRGRTLDVLFGNGGTTGHEVHLLDWETSPLAEICFTCAPGEEYEIEVGDREVSGRVLAMTSVAFDRGELVAVSTATERFDREPDGSWRASTPQALALPARPVGARAAPAPESVVLDPTQQQVVDLPPARSVLVLGEAGFGKTTVALHRLRRLHRLAGPHFRAAVVVPTEGLSRLTHLLLERMGIGAAVEVWFYDRWVAAQARQAFPQLPRAIYADTPAAVLRFKRHPALRLAIEELVATTPVLLDEEGYDLRRGARIHRGDLEHLFGDQRLLERVRAATGESLRAGDVVEVLAHTRAQFRATAAEEFAHVRRDSLVTADGRGLDDGTPGEVTGSLDTEDFAVLFELDRLRAERTHAPPARLPRYDALVLDEAQELAPLELALLGRCVARSGAVIVAGDEAQQIDPAAGFGGWTQTMAEVGQPDHARVVLAQNHRCPPEVTALAQPLRTATGIGAATGPAIVWTRQPSRLHVLLALTRAVSALLEEDPTCSVAIIARTAEGARSLARHLEYGHAARLSLEGRFDFRPGLVLTCVAEVKGLEFDHVIVPDATAEAYPDTPESRRSLYVALTRATHQLVLAAGGTPTPLLRWA